MAKASDLVIATTPCRPDNSFTNDHHYLTEDNDQVGKPFADAKAKAAENELFFKALNQVLNGTIYFRRQPSIIKPPQGRPDFTKFILSYPVIICNNFDSAYRVDTNGTDHKAIQANFQFEMDYAYSGAGQTDISDYFLVDIVSFNLLDEFIQKVEKDKDLAAFFLNNS